VPTRTLVVKTLGDETYLYVTDRNPAAWTDARVGGFCRRIAFSTGQAEVLASGLGLPVCIWGDASYLYVTDQTVVRRITKATGEKGHACRHRAADGLG